MFTPAPESSRRAASPSKAVPKKRGRKPRASVAPPPTDEETSQLLTPEPSVSNEPDQASEATEATITPDPPPADPIMSNTEEDTTPVPESRPEPEPEITQMEVKVEAPVPEPETEPEPILDPQPPAKVIEELNTQQTMLEPIDIVVKRRAAAIPAMHEPVAPAQRTVITWLVLNNFKSYAGRQEVGPFHASFSSVVGPNGSGKSNVIDSLLFVFGFRASKMRQSKLSALIHNSAAFPDLDYCEVEVHFQEVKDLPNGGHEVIPNSQLVVSRRAFKNNSSKYYI